MVVDQREGPARAQRENSSTPWAVAQGAHSWTSTGPLRSELTGRVITALLSHTPTSWGCATAHGHSQWRRGQLNVGRLARIAARIAGSVPSFSIASEVAAAIRWAHSPNTLAAASPAAAICRARFSPSLSTVSVWHRVSALHQPSRWMPVRGPVPSSPLATAISSCPAGWAWFTAGGMAHDNGTQRAQSP